MAVTRSLGWNWGTFSELGGGLAQWVQAVPEIGKAAAGKGPAPEITTKMAYTLALPLLVGSMGAVLNAMFGQKPEDLKDFYFIKTGETDERGNPVRLSLPSYMKDVFHAAHDPLSTVTNKLHPILSTTAQMLQNKDFYGVEIRHAGDHPIRQILQELGYVGGTLVPFTGRNLMKEIKAGAPPVVIAGGLAGLTQAPNSVGKSDAQNLADEIARASMPRRTRTSEEAEHSALKSRVIALLRNKDPRAGQVLRTALQERKLGQKDVPYIQRLAGMTALQASMSHLGLNDAERVFEKANPREKMELAAIMQRKRAEAPRN